MPYNPNRYKKEPIRKINVQIDAPLHALIVVFARRHNLTIKEATEILLNFAFQEGWKNEMEVLEKR